MSESITNDSSLCFIQKKLIVFFKSNHCITKKEAILCGK